MVTNPGIHLGESISKQHLLPQVHYFFSLESPHSCFNDVQGNAVVTMFPVHVTIERDKSENSSKLVL